MVYADAAGCGLIEQLRISLIGDPNGPTDDSAMTSAPDADTEASKPDPDVRDGEIAVALPERFDASVYFIGRIRTPWKTRKDCPKNARAARETGAVCTIELDPRWAPALKDIETCTHLVVLYWMDKARRDLAVQVPGHLRQGPRHLCAALAGAAEPDRHERGQAGEGRRQPGRGGGARLPRRHAAPRHQALLRLDRLDPRCGDRRLAGRSVIPGGRKRFTRSARYGRPDPYHAARRSRATCAPDDCAVNDFLRSVQSSSLVAPQPCRRVPAEACPKSQTRRGFSRLGYFKDLAISQRDRRKSGTQSRGI